MDITWMPLSASTGISFLFSVLHAQHGRLAGTVEVGIQHAHARTHACHGGSEIGSGSGFADTAFAGCDGDNVFDAFDGGNAGLYFVCCDFSVNAEVDMRIARDADDGFLQAVGDVGGDMPDGESEFQSDMEAVGTFFQQFDGFFTAERAFGAGDFYCFDCSGNGGDIHVVLSDAVAFETERMIPYCLVRTQNIAGLAFQTTFRMKCQARGEMRIMTA